MPIKKIIFLTSCAAVFALVTFAVIGCFAQKAHALPTEAALPQEAAIEAADGIDEAVPAAVGDPPAVYFTANINPAGLMTVYEALGLEANGKVAVKISTGEPGNTHFLNPNLIKDLVQKVGGTIIECNTAYGGRRANTAMHYQVAKAHGFTDIAPVVILDEKSDISIPVSGGKHLKEDIVGARFSEFNFHIVLSHFKGHQMGGFGGALKNMSIGYASSAGKAWIHSAGKSRTSMRGGNQNDFLESMAEAAKAVADSNKGRFIYINVMNNLSVDCDCSGNPAKPTMADIGILASLDPVALDKACVDLAYAAKDGKDIIERIESRNGLLTIDHAEKIGLGSKTYRLITK
jgi:uncharacterized Fe-S center protein